MFNSKILHSLAVASFLALSGVAQADVTISSGGVVANINNFGTFAGSYDTPPVPAGTPGLSYNGVEFVNIDNPSAWFSLSTSGGNYVSQYGGTYGSTGIPGTLTYGVGPTAALTLNTGSTGIGLVETWTITAANQLAVSVGLTNNTGAALTGVQWGVGFDPDQGGSGKNITTNTILGQGANAAVSAADYLYGTNLAVTLANTTSASAYAIGAYIGTDCCTAVVPSVALGGAQAVGFGNVADDSISLAYNIGNLCAGCTATIGYDYVFTAVPEPKTYAMLLAGLGLIGFSARRRMNT